MENTANANLSSKDDKQEELIYIFNDTYACEAKSFDEAEKIFHNMTVDIEQPELWKDYENDLVFVERLSKSEYMSIVERAISAVAKKYDGYYSICFSSQTKYSDISEWVSDDTWYAEVDVRVIFDNSFGDMYSAYLEMKGLSGVHIVELRLTALGEYDEQGWLDTIEAELDEFIEAENKS